MEWHSSAAFKEIQYPSVFIIEPGFLMLLLSSEYLAADSNEKFWAFVDLCKKAEFSHDSGMEKFFYCNYTVIICNQQDMTFVVTSLHFRIVLQIFY